MRSRAGEPGLFPGKEVDGRPRRFFLTLLSRAGMTRHAGVLLVMAAAVLWSTGGLAIKSVPLGPLSLASVRCLIAGLVFLPFLRPGRLRWTWLIPALVASYAVMSLTFVTATKWTAAGNAVAIQYAAPLIIFGVQAATGSARITLARTAPLLLCGLGIGLFLLEPKSGTSLAGNLVALVSAFGFAAVISLLRVLRDQHQPSLVCLTNLGTGLALLPFVADTPGLIALAPAGWAALFYLGVIQIGLAYLAFATGVKTVPALKASTLGLLEPVLNPLWVFIAIGERQTGYGLAGAAAILAAVFFDLLLNPAAAPRSGPEPKS